jgi:ABC-type antimicrobial peptide transport system permease subunit
MMLTRALSRALWGVGAGSVLALLLAYSMQSLLFGVAPNDPVSFLIVAMLLFCLAAVATLIPTVQAIRSCPLIALREG